MSKTWLRIISVLEIVGGIVGIGFVIWWFLATPFNVFALILAPIPLSIYILSLVAGIALWRGNSFGRNASIVVQAIQLPKIVSPVIIFMFSFGFDLWVHILLTRERSNLGFELRFLAFNQFFFNVPDAPFGLGVSITACFFLVMLLRHKPGKAEEAAILPPPPPIAEWRDGSQGHTYVPGTPRYGLSHRAHSVHRAKKTKPPPSVISVTSVARSCRVPDLGAPLI